MEVELQGKVRELREHGEEITEKALRQAEKVSKDFSDALQRMTARTQH